MDLGDEPGQARQPERCEAGDDEEHRPDRHLLRHAGVVIDLAVVRLVVERADEQEEQRRHHAVREHLQHRAAHADEVERAEPQEHVAHVRDRGEAGHQLEVGLAQRADRAVERADDAEREQRGRPELAALGHDLEAEADDAERAELHQHASMQHRHGRGRGGVAVRRPRVEREDAAQRAAAEHDEREHNLLERRVVGRVEQGRQVERAEARLGEDAEDGGEDQDRRRDEHHHQLHRAVFAPARAPHRDEQVHRQHCGLVEQEPEEQVEGDERAVDPCHEHEQQDEEVLRAVLDLPGHPRPGQDHDAGEQHHRCGDTVDADLELHAVLAEEPDVLEPGPREHALELLAPVVEREEDVDGDREHRDRRRARDDADQRPLARGDEHEQHRRRHWDQREREEQVAFVLRHRSSRPSTLCLTSGRPRPAPARPHRSPSPARSLGCGRSART